MCSPVHQMISQMLFVHQYLCVLLAAWHIVHSVSTSRRKRHVCGVHLHASMLGTIS